ncbi:hypothetical protein [Paludisphaera sp.]|uniref:hypothetical protein n=1 Tax=Paludisphaera sp. TaxID=2017432 RepID=UPI00301C1BB6
MTTPGYIPGACNIGRAEVRLRWLVGWAGLVGAVALWGYFVWAGSPRPLRLWVGGPALMAALGFLQARRNFCVNYGLGGVAGFDAKAGRTERVEEEEARALDRRTSWRIIANSALIAATAAVIAYLAP